MAYTKTLSKTTGRGALVLLLVCTLGISALANRPSGAGVERLPIATSVHAFVSGTSTLVTITGTAPMAYAVRRPEQRLLVVELPGVDGSQLASAYSITSTLVEGMTVKHTLRDGVSLSSLQIALLAPVRERSRLEGNQLVVELMPCDAKDSAKDAGTLDADSAAQSRPTPTPTGSNTTTQASQGAQYGQAGFVGEPISVNVVNSDIRDILNYVTEQYGVNFVVDSSVKSVPVTINVTDVPWNFALDSILRANRLGIEVNGNILRVATINVLKEEAQMRAEEESARASLKDAQLQNEPLVTEIIRLNYARAGGTLAGFAGSSADFAGGKTAQSFAGAGGDTSGSSGEQGILPIIARRLSRRGGIEVDGRSNTLIVTDVKVNIDAIRRLVLLLDQPEPQVEIETRIVIANRNFSRDLGMQLNAIVLSSRGGNIGFGTAPGSPALSGQSTIGPRLGGVPQGIQNPSGTLGANNPNTVIGLTTGLIGTAQISALITAAESKGQAKIIATPRVTALNNRSAQIESGSQIPVVTPQQGSGGGATVFTTTFVSVPLRLSVTPQITDAGTVILHVTMENNSVNLTLTNALGTPGIDTQRMSTEVLVPDGGTTVVGGVLNDRESETQNRTPGLGTLPILGNLFKRKAISRNTDEILFFITPRIYRPDYQGHRVESEPASTTRSTSLPQPVPLGNPSTNTPIASPSQQLQQQQQQVPAPGYNQPSQPAATNVAPPAGVNPRP
ncbi:MAG: type pilus assembly protein PilQ [Acidobacteriota bacterium]|jgi:type IV pilus assembly protein PilQ|nr:type pilus assembly protein PilQ [Acidobacteriota bacterium]